MYTLRCYHIISIHALRVEGDRRGAPDHCRYGADFYPRPPGGGRRATAQPLTTRMWYFYPRPPGGGRRCLPASDTSRALFLSTPSGWRATPDTDGDGFPDQYFYPRPPGGGRREGYRVALTDVAFLSTPSGWRATLRHKLRPRQDQYFYPRPPGGGRLFWVSGISTATLDFYPRPPGGGRHGVPTVWRIKAVFLSTPSGWRATGSGCYEPLRACISIHALRVEGDSKNGQSFHLFLRKREKKLPL